MSNLLEPTKSDAMHQPFEFPAPINGFLRWMQCHDVPGKYWLYQKLCKYFPTCVIRYRINERWFKLPASEWCFWLEFGPERYYLDEMLPFCETINLKEETFVLFDLGADIGTVSSLVAQQCPNLSHLVAFEPNPNAFALLTHNLEQMDSAYQPVLAGVSDFNGPAELVADERLNDHEGHIVRSANGNTCVVRLDDWLAENGQHVPDFVVIKLDVEGQELNAIEGARQLIQGAKTLLVLLEIHPDVLAQTKQSPEQLFAAFEDLRDMQWQLPLLKNAKLDRSKDFFQQFEQRQYDVIGVSAGYC